jgi:hypothetical protein
VPLIQEELISGNEAGMDHYIKAGRMLNEVKDSEQVPHGSWTRWWATPGGMAGTAATGTCAMSALPHG